MIQLPHMTLDEIKAKYPDIGINTSGGPDSYQDGVTIVERDPSCLEWFSNWGN